MTDVVGTGSQAVAMDSLREMIARSSTFQTAIGATGDAAAKIAAAKLRIHLTAVAASSNDYTRPFALIATTGNHRDRRFTSNYFLPGGELELVFEDDLADGYEDDPGNAEKSFINFVEAVVADVKLLANTPGYMIINSYEALEGPMQVAKADEDDTYIYALRLRVAWGLSG